MSSAELICLANSRKLSARCIAGLRTDTGGWIRPISNAEHGELTYALRSLGPAGEPQNFDLIRVGLAKAMPSPSQPENWLVDGSSWTLIERPAPARFAALVKAAIHSDERLFDSFSDRISAESFHSSHAKESLLLVEPDNVRWLVDSFGAKRRSRVLFKQGHTDYNLPLTDPSFEQRLKRLDLGFHKSEEIGISRDSRLLFTISLGEAFEGYCYKLAAAVLTWPTKWPW
jgi:hypothetical protein